MIMQKRFIRKKIFKKVLQKICLQKQIGTSLNKKKKIICAFSGGQDSNFLLVFLLYFQIQKNVSLETFYYNHLIQILNFFSVWHAVRFHFFFHCPVSIGFSLYFLHSENQARISRRKNFERFSQLTDTATLFLGHTATDKLETFLGNFQRGVGSRGLRTISSKTVFEMTSFSSFFSGNQKLLKQNYLTQSFSCSSFFCKKKRTKNFSQKFLDTNYLIKLKKQKKDFEKSLFFLNRKSKFQKKTREYSLQLNRKMKLLFLMDHSLVYSHYSDLLFFQIFLTRPLLNFHRTDISTLCELFEFPIVTDPTNEVVQISRNRIRNQLISFARYFYVKQFDLLLWKFLDIHFSEQEFLQNFMSVLFNKFLIQKSREEIYHFFFKLSSSSQRFLIQKMFLHSTTRQLSYFQIETIRKNLNKRNLKFF